MRVAPSFDVEFDYLPIGPSQPSSSMQPAVTITLSQLKTLKLTTLNTVHRKTKKKKDDLTTK